MFAPGGTTGINPWHTSSNNFGATRGVHGRRGSGVGGHPPAVYYVTERIIKLADREPKNGLLTMHEMNTYLRGTVLHQALSCAYSVTVL